MQTLKETAQTFLNQKRIAVAGVSRDPNSTANLIYRTLRKGGREVFAVNPNATQVEGGPCFPGVGAIPGGVDAVVIATRPEVAESIVQDSIAAGARMIWMHRAIGKGSVSAAATALGRSNGITVIDGACPMMYVEGADIFHKCARWFMGVTGHLPRPHAS